MLARVPNRAGDRRGWRRQRRRHAVLGAHHGVFDCPDSLDDQGETGEVPEPVEPVPGESGVVGGSPVGHVGDSNFATLDQVHAVAQAAPVESRWPSVFVADVALFGTRAGGVDRKADRLESGGLGPGHEYLGDLVVEVVKLEPERSRGDFGNLFD